MRPQTFKGLSVLSGGSCLQGLKHVTALSNVEDHIGISVWYINASSIAMCVCVCVYICNVYVCVCVSIYKILYVFKMGNVSLLQQ
ncbi:hypothetical protein RND71_041497 [Anisodus tanguticus]|uniref:Uncharacterized protein n=1 Tax=Anisodus tanguticus TaxID=243964 RepID=A0AAE1QUV2_9SOLA|nr:hypothetical protein RND71_041497 [Anisodus tanguticus]